MSCVKFTNKFVFSCIILLSELKELLKIMGLPNWMNWLTWFLDAFFATFITVVIVILLVCVEWSPGNGKIIMDSDGFMMFIFFMLYGVSLIWICFAISTLFTSRKLMRIILHFSNRYLPAPSLKLKTLKFIGCT